MQLTTEFRLITNALANNHLGVLNAGFLSAESIIICVAFLKKSGLSLMRDALFRAVANGVAVKVIVGLDFYLTEPDALEELFERFAGCSNAALLLCKQGRETFHPKIYYWEERNRTQILIGSANATRGGIASNIEVSIAHTVEKNSALAKDLKSFISSLEAHERVSVADGLMLSQYRRRYAIYSERRGRAEKDAAEEISKLFLLDKKKLKKYLAEYRVDTDQQENLRVKRIRYKEAKKQLESLASGNINSKAAFLERYELLVGKEGVPALWHSGSLFRSKAKVASRYMRFINMLQAIRGNIKASPEVVLNIAREHAAEIGGIGLNVITEIMNTYAPRKFAVLNKNPTDSLEHLGFERFGSLNKALFTGSRYVRFNNLIRELATSCGFENLSDVDHFLNYIYWKYVKSK